MTIAIIGAGVAGLTCAQKLVAAGREVRLFDKGRGPGGRLSTRRAQTELGEIRFDHGAQYFTASRSDFAIAIKDWAASGAVTAWRGRIATNSADGSWSEIERQGTRWVGTPSMNQVVKHLAAGIDVQWGCRASEVAGEPGAWVIQLEDGTQHGAFSHVVSAVPAEQVSPLFATLAPDLASHAVAVTSTACWTVMTAFESRVVTNWDGARPNAGPLAWVCRNTSKPGRGEQEAWVLQATSDWSAKHLEDDPGRVADDLISAFGALVETEAPVFKSAHRWRYAFPTPSNGAAKAAFDPKLGLGTCGDWHVSPNIEGAWISGKALAEHIISQA